MKPSGPPGSVSSPTDEAEMPVPGDLLEKGMALQKAGTPFVTSISVQKPRNLDLIVKAMEREAEFAGASFYYNWKDKRGNRIEGASIGLANSLAREWTNCAVLVDFQETDETFVITPRFIDLEKGFQCERVFRQGKNVVQGNFDAERKLDMALQIGQSKAIRNVVVNAVPRWLVERIIESAKQAVIKGINPNKIAEWNKWIIDQFKRRKVTEEQLVEKAGKPVSEWASVEIADFKGDLKALESSEATVLELFPPKEKAQPEGEVDLQTALTADASTATPPVEPGGMSEAEKKAAIAKEKREVGKDPKVGKEGKTGALFPDEGGPPQ